MTTATVGCCPLLHFVSYVHEFGKEIVVEGLLRGPHLGCSKVHHFPPPLAAISEVGRTAFVCLCVCIRARLIVKMCVFLLF